MSLGGSSVAVVQLPGGQYQVQGVIQSAQSSVIQSPQAQSVTVSRAAPFFWLSCFVFSFSKLSHNLNINPSHGCEIQSDTKQ